MKYLAAWIVLISVSQAWAVQPCGVGVCNNVTATHVVTPYATAAGVPYYQPSYQIVPVAILANVQYSLGGVQAYAPQPTVATEPKLSKADMILDRLDKMLAKMDGGAVVDSPRLAAKAAMVGPMPSVQANCVSCHNPAKASGKFDITGPLTAEQRLKSVNKILSGKMPAGKPIENPDIAGKLIGELSGVKEGIPADAATE
jgi:hypothetical protein